MKIPLLGMVNILYINYLYFCQKTSVSQQTPCAIAIMSYDATTCFITSRNDVKQCEWERPYYIDFCRAKLMSRTDYERCRSIFYFALCKQTLMMKVD